MFDKTAFFYYNKDYVFERCAMVLDIKPILNTPGTRLDFQFALDLADVDFNGVYPIQNPVVVTGQVCNTAGMLTLTFDAHSVLESVCDRCLQPFQQPKTIHREFLLTTDAEPLPQDDDILPLDHGTLDMNEVARTEFILGMDTKTLCSEDCKGICPGCGVNLNQGRCSCKKPADPRWAALAKLLEDEG